MTLPDEYIDFLNSCSDLELVMIQYEARSISDQETVDAILEILQQRLIKSAGLDKSSR